MVFYVSMLLSSVAALASLYLSGGMGATVINLLGVSPCGDVTIGLTVTGAGILMLLVTNMLVWNVVILGECYNNRAGQEMNAAVSAFYISCLVFFLAGDMVSLALAYECLNVPLLVMLTSRVHHDGAHSPVLPNKGTGQAMMLLAGYAGLSGVLLVYWLLSVYQTSADVWVHLSGAQVQVAGRYSSVTGVASLGTSCVGATHEVLPLAGLEERTELSGPIRIQEQSRGMAVGEAMCVRDAGTVWALWLAGGVKIALVPVHVWLCKVHVECSTLGSVLLAGLAMKSGYYIHRLWCELLWGCCTGLWLIAMIGGGLVIGISTQWQVDSKRWIAMYSVGHVQCLYLIWVTGGPGCRDVGVAILLGMVGHSLVSAGMFTAVGTLTDFRQQRVQIELRQVRSASMRTLLLVLVLCNGAYPGTVLFCTEVVGLGGVSLRSLSLCLATIGVSGINLVTGLTGVLRMVTVADREEGPNADLALGLLVGPYALTSILLGSHLLLPCELLLIA